MRDGTLFIIAAPSGTGKTSMVRTLMDQLEGLTLSISHTTRQRRPGEVNGEDYYFVDPDSFHEMVRQQAFLEHAQVFDNWYGTARQTVDSALAAGRDVLLEIDWQGAQQVRNQIPGATSVFILPPSLKTLAERLKGRGQDNDSIIRRRMTDAVEHISHYSEFEYLIVNDDFQQAVDQLRAVIVVSRLKKERQVPILQPLLNGMSQD